MNFASKLNQTIVYWAPAGNTASGRPTLAAGVEFTGRWQREAKVFTDSTGEERVSNSIVYADPEDVTLETNGRLFLGQLSDLTAGQQAGTDIVTTSEIIRKPYETPGVSGTQKLMKVFTNRG